MSKHVTRGLLYYLALLLLYLSAISIPGCGSSTVGTPGISDADVSARGLASTLVAEQAGFTLYQYDTSGQFGGTAHYQLQLQEERDLVKLQVFATADQLKCTLLELRYDATQLSPQLCSPQEWPATPELLKLAVLDRPGRVYYGAVLPQPQTAPGVSGAFALCTIEFLRDGGRSISATPELDGANPNDQVQDMLLDPVSGQLTYHYANTGDYDQNSEVNIADLVPVGVHFGASSTETGGFALEDVCSVVDGDSNGVINIADITPLGMHWGHLVQEWRLYGGAEADYPADEADDNGSAALLGTLIVTAYSGDTASERLAYDELVAGAAGYGGECCWLRPFDGETEGLASNCLNLPQGDRTPPVWTHDPGGVGILRVVPLDGGARLQWGEATDADSPPVTYVIYYNPGASVDFGTATRLELAVSVPPDPAVDQQEEISGLDNGVEYAFAVRAQDAASPPNEDSNANVLTCTPAALQQLPDTVTQATTINGPAQLPNGGTCDVATEGELRIRGDLEIAGTLEGHAHYLQLVVEGNLLVSGSILHTPPDQVPPPSDGNAGSLNILVHGNVEFTDTSHVSTNGNFYLVDDPESFISPEDAATDVDQGDIGQFPYTLAPHLPHETGAAKAADTVLARQVSQTQYYGPPTYYYVSGDWGKVPTPPPGTRRIVYRIYPVAGYLSFQDFSIEASKGRDGADAIGGCSPVGGDGQDCPFRLRINCGRAMTFNNVTIKLGDGGDGGMAVTDTDCDPGVAKGGKGGKPNNRFLFTAGQSINIVGSFNFNPGNGGKGGDATAFGANKAPGCIAESGGDALAFGGDGGEVPRWGVSTRGNVGGASSMNLGEAKGGKGGDGTASAGDGGADTCVPGAKGGDGGTAVAEGGRGGKSTFTNGGSGAAGGGARGGDGGSTIASGGDGGDGNSCGKLPGGDGGDGGYAIATAGDGGIASGAGPSTNGEQGGADAQAGDGGDGGDGWGPGVGGKGGLASATGNPANAEDGDPGTDGMWDFAAFSHHQIVMTDLPHDPSVPISPIPGGLFPLPIYDMNAGGEVVGNLLIELTPLEPGAGFEIINWDLAGHPGGPTVLRMMGRCLMRIDKSKAVYGSGSSPPWVGLEYSQYYTACDFSSDFVRGQFSFAMEPLNDFIIPGNDAYVPISTEFYVEPTGGEWDNCDITCGASCITEVIEITIIDP